MGFIADMMERSKKDIRKDRIKLLYSEVQQAYKDKIDRYRKLLKALETERAQLLDFHTQECDIKKLENFSVQGFMSRVEKIGIDEMNHQTILDMLTKQYKDWFDEEY